MVKGLGTLRRLAWDRVACVNDPVMYAILCRCLFESPKAGNPSTSVSRYAQPNVGGRVM